MTYQRRQVKPREELKEWRTFLLFLGWHTLSLPAGGVWAQPRCRRGACPGSRWRKQRGMELRTPLGLVLVSRAIGAAGCLATWESTTTTHGTQISQATLEQVEPGETTEGSVIATFGRPTSTEKLSGGGELLKYEFKETRDSSLALFLLFAGSEHQTETRSVAYFEVRDGVPQRCWLEQRPAPYTDPSNFFSPSRRSSGRGASRLSSLR